MTRKDFVAIADAVVEAKNYFTYWKDINEPLYIARLDAINKIVAILATDVFPYDNERFNKEKFLKACQTTQEQKEIAYE